MDPSIPFYGRFTPGGKRFYETNAFWRRKTEVGPAAAFGIGDRPEYGLQNAGWAVSPNNYGDVSKHEKCARRNVHRPDITLKKRYPSMDEKYRERSSDSGPGPGRYDIRIPPGKASLTHPSRLPQWTMQTRLEDNTKVLEEMRKPGPAEYAEHLKPGCNSPINHGTLYDIALKGRTDSRPRKQKGPGPGQYTLKSFSDKYNLMPDYVPSYMRRAKTANAADVDVEDNEDFGDTSNQFGMKRAETAPGSLRVK